MKKPTISDDNPMKETSEDRLERINSNVMFEVFGIHRELRDLKEMMRENTAKLEELEHVMSHSMNIPSRPVRLRFNHRVSTLYLKDNIGIRFDGNEADVLSIMFRKKDFRPFKKKYFCAEVAERFKKKNGDLDTKESVYRAVKRVQDKIEKEYQLRGVITLTTKEFFFTPY